MAGTLLFLVFKKTKIHSLNLFIAAIVNIILNSIQSIPQNKKGAISIELLHNANKFLIIINDNGRGIPKNEMKNIFDPFYTTKQEGTGLGLSIAKNIISNHNGTLEVISKENVGTKVILSLPFKKG